MSVAERARRLAERTVYEAPDTDICGVPEAIQWHAAIIEQALLAERRLAMEDAMVMVRSERVGDSTEPDRAYNTALEHACIALRAAAEKEVGNG